MKYLHVTERDGRYVSELREAAVPEPRADEVLVRVAASGLNRADLSQFAGRYPRPPGEPEILGLEVAGTLPGSGERVCALLAGGGHAEYVAAPLGQVFPAPRRLDLVAAAGIPEAFLTAFVTLVVEGGVSAGDGVLIHAGASGVGLAAIQLAKLVGARVAATTRTAGKLAAVTAAGADLALLSPDVAPQIEQRGGPDSGPVGLGPSGGGTVPGDLTVLAPGGRIITIGTLGGASAHLDLSLVIRKRRRLIGSTPRARRPPRKSRLGAAFP